MAECHPVGFQWVAEAKARGAMVIHVDPRFTRTSAVADKHIPIRAGSDVVLLGALINHVLTHDLWFKDYVRRLHQRRDADQRGLPRHRGPGRAVLRVRPGDRQVRPVDLGVREPRCTCRSRCARTAAATSTAARLGDAGGAALGRATGSRSNTPETARRDPAAPADASSRSSNGTIARYTPEMVRRSVRHRPRDVRLPGHVGDGQLGPRTDHLLRLRGRLDPTHPGRPVHPHRRDPAAAARQRRPAGRRDHGAARPCQHSGLHGHPHPLRHAARLSADAQGRAPRHPPPIPGPGRLEGPEGLLGQRRRLLWSVC